LIYNPTSEEVAYTYTTLMDWMNLNDLNLNNKSLNDVIELKYVQYISVCDKSFTVDDYITVKLCLPISSDTGKRKTCTIFNILIYYLFTSFAINV
jgi:hypothetical protein